MRRNILFVFLPFILLAQISHPDEKEVAQDSATIVSNHKTAIGSADFEESGLAKQTAKTMPPPIKTPEQIQLELNQAEALYQKALTMFSPWYTGPLITPGASMMPVANGNTQPYLFFIDNYAFFDKNRKSISLPSNLVQLKASANIQTGVTNNFDINLTFNGQTNWQFGHHGGGFGDMGLTGGFLIYNQTRYIPGAKLTIAQTFPTGRYKGLDRFLVNVSGAGAYSTQFGLGFTKLLLWTTRHPLNLRCFLGYTLSTTVDVKGFNSYGGGYGCRGKVRPGNSFNADFGAEVSLTQKWVAALDVVYVSANRTKFHGNPGVLANGTSSTVGLGYSDQLSLAPAIEYNINPNVGIIAGGWFSVYGRKSFNFGSGIISITYSFP